MSRILAVVLAALVSTAAVGARADWNAGLGPFSLVGWQDDGAANRVRLLDLALVRAFNLKNVEGKDRTSWDLVTLPFGIGLASYGSEGDSTAQFDFASLPWVGGALRFSSDQRERCGRLLYLLSLCLDKSETTAAAP